MAGAEAKETTTKTEYQARFFTTDTDKAQHLHRHKGKTTEAPSKPTISTSATNSRLKAV